MSLKSSDKYDNLACVMVPPKQNHTYWVSHIKFEILQYS